MKQITFILLLSFSIFLSGFTTAQVVNEKKSDSKDIKSEQKTNPAVQGKATIKSDTARIINSGAVNTRTMPQTNRKEGRTKTNASGNTIKELNPGGKKISNQKDPFKTSGQANSSKSSKKQYIYMGEKLGKTGSEAKITDASGNLIMDMDSAGTIRNAHNKIIGMYYGNGQLYTPKGDKSVSVDPNGLISDKDGAELGRISKFGSVIDKSGGLMGYILKDGSIMDANKKEIGKVTGIDVQLAALFFFTNQGKK